MFNCDKCSREFKRINHLTWHEKMAHGPRDLKLMKSDRSRKAWLIRTRGHQCEVCKRTEWMGQKIPIELDHVDGHPDHNEEENLRLICLNCHAQTPTWKAKNIGNHSGTVRQETMAKYPDYRKI